MASGESLTYALIGGVQADFGRLGQETFLLPDGGEGAPADEKGEAVFEIPLKFLRYTEVRWLAYGEYWIQMVPGACLSKTPRHFCASIGMSETRIGRPINVVQGFSARG
jgi:hypothetical protein